MPKRNTNRRNIFGGVHFYFHTYICIYIFFQGGWLWVGGLEDKSSKRIIMHDGAWLWMPLWLARWGERFTQTIQNPGWDAGLRVQPRHRSLLRNYGRDHWWKGSPGLLAGIKADTCKNWKEIKIWKPAVWALLGKLRQRLPGRKKDNKRREPDLVRSSLSRIHLTKVLVTSFYFLTHLCCWKKNNFTSKRVLFFCTLNGPLTLVAKKTEALHFWLAWSGFRLWFLLLFFDTCKTRLITTDYGEI